ncbi:MAG: hypothetical protein RIR18_926 [Pseudomonadota bacterium]
MKKYLRLSFLSTALTAALLAGCASTTAPGTVGIERQQMLLISSQEMNKASEQAYRSTLKQAGDKGKLLQSGPYVDRVRAIARRLIPATAVFRADAPKWKWEANVIESPELNAWCMPGGKIAVYTGLIEKLHATDDELAAVMGHEIAHALREHGRERVSRAQMTNIGLSVISIATGMGQIATDLAGTVANVTFSLPNSREAEVEADRIGVELAARAGYNPHAAVSLWEKMEKSGGQKPPEWLSTHPSGSSRINDLSVYAERVEDLYEEATRQRKNKANSRNND